jgi:hypothetical protein
MRGMPWGGFHVAVSQSLGVLLVLYGLCVSTLQLLLPPIIGMLQISIAGPSVTGLFFALLAGYALAAGLSVATQTTRDALGAQMRRARELMLRLRGTRPRSDDWWDYTPFDPYWR